MPEVSRGELSRQIRVLQSDLQDAHVRLEKLESQQGTSMGMVKLRDFRDEDDVWVNPAFVVSVRNIKYPIIVDGGGPEEYLDVTEVMTSGGGAILVKETWDEVFTRFGLNNGG